MFRLSLLWLGAFLITLATPVRLDDARDEIALMIEIASIFVLLPLALPAFFVLGWLIDAIRDRRR